MFCKFEQDSMGKDGTQLLRHCVRLLVLVSTDLLSVRLSGIITLFLICIWFNTCPYAFYYLYMVMYASIKLYGTVSLFLVCI